jgi:hypothetical protein
MNGAKDLPLGIQDFKQLIENNFLYVDKTNYLHKLIQKPFAYFFSRPQRFGKSLTVSTLYYLFNGDKELFRDTYIFNKYDFKPYPIVYLDFSSITSKSANEIIYRSHALYMVSISVR